MKFSKLPKEKRNQLLLLVLVTLTAVSGLGFGLIRYQYHVLAQLAQLRASADTKYRRIQDAVQHADRIEAELAESRKALCGLEEDMATGDLYSWVIDTLRRFKLGYKVDLRQFGPISSPADVDLLPAFPYKQAKLTIAGTAHYHDLGRFLADFENQFPHIRILNLTAESNAGSVSEDPEFLSFTIEIVTLVKPNAT